MSSFGNLELTPLTVSDTESIGAVLEAFFYGLYCIIFGQYLHVYTKKNKDQKSILVYPFIMLFLLSTLHIILNLQVKFWVVLRPGTNLDFIRKLNIVSVGIYGFSDFICQAILIYRSWVMWDYVGSLVVIPSIMAFTLLGTSLVQVVQLCLQSRLQRPSNLPRWILPLAISSYSISLALNAVVTGLLVFRITMIHRQSRRSTVRTNRRLYNLSPAISILIETGMMTFVSQLLLIIVVGLRNASAVVVGSPMIIIYGLTPTIVFVRVGMKNLYNNHDHTSGMVQSSMTFATSHDVQTESTSPEIPPQDLISAEGTEKSSMV